MPIPMTSITGPINRAIYLDVSIFFVLPKPPTNAKQRAPGLRSGGGTPSHCRTRMNFRPGLRAAAHPLWGISPRRPRTCECYAEPIGTQVVRGACETLWKWREDLQTCLLYTSDAAD